MLSQRTWPFIMILADDQSCYHLLPQDTQSTPSNQPGLDPLAALGKQCIRGYG